MRRLSYHEIDDIMARLYREFDEKEGGKQMYIRDPKEYHNKAFKFVQRRLQEEKYKLENGEEI